MRVLPSGYLLYQLQVMWRSWDRVGADCIAREHIGAVCPSPQQMFRPGGAGSSPIFVMKVLNEAVSCLLASPEGFC